ncbi:DUF2470 domain-containing protein [Modestobacter versicolor]|uniref:DUF2470 domain-containing protein n=1 Tax=Modestobacter versicolor TaxID=429133 RepID=A0A323VG05_9ACTN|nr:DUF2470 domain-containing protein [Modestobacter versicolor]MBB3675202.1 hypothetical protein [Modestobacter versicolor]PZA22983.1 DUF2470 domain-containing protein [Modestobacter versicolor]
MTRSTRPAAPGPSADAVRPTVAERARTVAARPAAAVCAAGIDGSRVLGHATTDDGQVLLVVPTDGEVCTAVRHSADGDLAALLMVTDHAPVQLREPVRAQVWLSGWLTPVPPADERAAALAFADVAPVSALLDVGRGTTLLRLDLAEVVLGECGTVTEVAPEDYLAAAPDPLAAVEAHALQHLDEAHPEDLALLRSRVPGRWLAKGDVVRPLGLDRCGFRLRIEQRSGHRDVRVPFAQPVSTADELGRAVHQLMCATRRGCPER